LVRGDLKEKKNLTALWEYAEAILPKKKADLFTQAIMDLGATICLPKSPNCMACPVSLPCLAYQEGVQNKLPEKSVSKKVPHYDFVATIIQKGKQVLIKKRPEKGLLGGLWEFPGGKVGHNSQQTLRPDPPLLGERKSERLCEINSLVEKEIGQIVSLSELPVQIQHAFTHFKMTLHLFRGVVKKAVAPDPALKWVLISELGDYPFSAAHQVIVLKLQGATTATPR
jgi:A/G-specific adenine glycosylase